MRLENRRDKMNTKMNTLKGWITTTCLAATLLMSTMNTNAGVIIGGLNEPMTPCTETTIKTAADLGGVIIGGLTGVIIGGLTGVMIGGVRTEPVDCGVSIGG